MSYHGITNEELIVLNYIIKRKLDETNESLNNKLKLKIKGNSPDTYSLSQIPLTDAFIEKAKNESWYVLLTSLFEKTDKIVDILRDIDDYKLLIDEIEK